MIKFYKWLVCSVILMVMHFLPAYAQYEIAQSVFGSGGIPVKSLSYSLSSTLGQTAIGNTQGINYRQPVGFWYSIDIIVGIPGLDDLIPGRFELLQNYPNPFNPVTLIRYAIPRAGRVRIEIFNILGQRVHTLMDSDQTPGYHAMTFDGSSLASGLYIYRMQADGFSEVRRMILTR